MVANIVVFKPASVAQLDACLTGDQKAAGVIPTGSATFFHGDDEWSLSPFR